MNNTMITIPYADAIEYGENTSALFKALWELTDLIRLESDLKKHHRAYLHVREDIDEKVKEARQIMTKVSVDMIGFYFKVDVPKCSNSDENTPFADAADDETVSIPKDEYELMIDDLLTMSEIIQCVADMRTQDVKAIREFGKFVPAFAAFEKNRLSLYREAAKEAEEIFDRWADEIDDLDEDFWRLRAGRVLLRLMPIEMLSGFTANISMEHKSNRTGGTPPYNLTSFIPAIALKS